MSAAAPVTLRLEVTPPGDAWELPEGVSVPESRPHDLILDLLKALLVAWASRAGRDLTVARNLAIRWDETRPRVGLDPDLCLIEPSPPGADRLTILRTWTPGHHAPVVAVEVVSEGHPYKDYVDAPARYAAAGVGELWVYDPLLAGPTHFGGPRRLQLWRRQEGGDFRRVYAGPGAVYSETLGAWLVTTEEGQRLRLADDAAGTRLWATAEEAARAQADAARAQADAARADVEVERAAKDEALARIAALEAELRLGR